MVYDLEEKFKEIVSELKKRGYTLEVPTNVLRTEIKRAFNLIYDDTSTEYMKTMKQFGFIKNKGAFWELQDLDKEEKSPDEQLQDDLKEIDKRIEASTSGQ